jgi:quercetin dioxygenase-like cupin family protein
MHQNVFEVELRSGGYTQIEAKAIDPKPATVEHTHDYDVKGLVLEGLFIVCQDDQPVTYRSGDIFAVPAGKRHSEEVGPDGARILVGRKFG